MKQKKSKKKSNGREKAKLINFRCCSFFLINFYDRYCIFNGFLMRYGSSEIIVPLLGYSFRVMSSKIPQKMEKLCTAAAFLTRCKKATKNQSVSSLSSSR